MNRHKQYSRIIISLTILLLGLIFVMVACENNDKTKKYQVEYNADIGGTISGLQSQEVKKGEDADLVIAVPNEGFVFLKWSDGNTNQVREDKNVYSNISVTATFEKEVFTANYQAEEGGYIVGETRQSILYGENGKIVTATPNIGYNFLQWSDGITEATRQEIDLKQDVNLSACFQKKSFTANYQAQEGGYIFGETNQSILYGEDGKTVTAVPYQGYKFIQWTDGVKDFIRQDTNLTESINLTAMFEFCFEGGSGTADLPYTISTYQQFLNIALFPQSHFLLTKDLDLSSFKHEPLFDDANMFNGFFDGNGFTISNMKIESSSRYPSLFGVINYGSVVNINIVDFDITIPSNDESFILKIGALAGESFGVLHNISVKGMISATGISCGQLSIGGIVGVAKNSVMDCSSDVRIDINAIENSATPYIGALLGMAFSNILSCNATGAIDIKQTKTAGYIGGFVGYYDANGIQEISDCICDVDIKCDSPDRYQKTPDNLGGFISLISTNKLLKISECLVAGSTLQGITVSGFIYSITGNVTSKITIEDSSAETDIKICSSAAGFIYRVISNGTCEIKNCFTKGSIITTSISAGFCLSVAENVKIIRCHSQVDINSFAMAAGFILSLTLGTVEECYSVGKIITVYQAVGFVATVSNSKIKNCYSTIDIEGTNTDPSAQYNTLICGLFLSISDCNISNCFFGGNLNGIIVTNPTIGTGSLVAGFAGSVVDSVITNCHLLIKDDSFATQSIARLLSPPHDIEITQYKSLEEMNGTAEALNNNQNYEIWIKGADDLPHLIYENY
jgi:hypothetical protein